MRRHAASRRSGRAVIVANIGSTSAIEAAPRGRGMSKVLAYSAACAISIDAAAARPVCIRAGPPTPRATDAGPRMIPGVGIGTEVAAPRRSTGVGATSDFRPVAPISRRSESKRRSASVMPSRSSSATRPRSSDHRARHVAGSERMVPNRSRAIEPEGRPSEAATAIASANSAHDPPFACRSTSLGAVADVAGTPARGNRTRSRARPIPARCWRCGRLRPSG